jgi:hypothetical protein
MAKVGAQRAAELTGKSKSTIQRAMNAGKLSYDVDGNGRRLVDVSELERVFGLMPLSNDNSPRNETTGITGSSAEVELELEKARHAIEIERLKMELRMAQEQLDLANNQIDDLKIQRDLWQKQAQQILITSQYSQKQSEERIAEFREREEARVRAIEAKKQPQGGVVNHSARPAQVQQAQPVRPAQQIQGSVSGNSQPPSQQQGGPVFRTVPTASQNRSSVSGEKTSLFASLFGTKKR